MAANILVITFQVLAVVLIITNGRNVDSLKTVSYGMKSLPRILSRNFQLFATKSKKTKASSTGILSWDDAKVGITLVIVESPAKARTIQKFVDSDSFIIDSCAGHVRDLPKAGSDYAERADHKKIIVIPELKINVADLGVDVRNNFEPVYVPLEGKTEVLKRLKKLSGECSRILLATDEDREGEAISWHLLEVLKPKVPVKRAVFHEITKDAILKSFENPREIDMNIVQSQETRR
jgi:DNA topoisomerase-1